MAGIYVASRSELGPMWQDFRRRAGYPIISTWIDESGPGETTDLGDLWRRCVDEASVCDALVAYHRKGDVWKGAFIEIGVALAAGAEVFVAGDPPGSWVNHHLVTRCLSPEHGLRLATAAIGLRYAIPDAV